MFDVLHITFNQIKKMLISQTFVVDLRCANDETMKTSILSANLADTIWEFALFLASCEPNQKKVFNWSLNVIDNSGKIHILLSKGEFSFGKLRDALTMLSSNEMDGCITTTAYEQDSLSACIDMSCLNETQINPIYLFLSHRSCWSEEAEKNIRRKKTLKEGEIDFTIVIVDDDENEENKKFAQYLASLELCPVVNFPNREDCFFQFFRSIAEKIFFPQVACTIEIGNHLIECKHIPLLLPETPINSINICECHNLPIIEKFSSYCSISNKKLPKSKIYSDFSLSGHIIPFNEGEQPEMVPKYIVKCRISTSKITESILTGTTKIFMSISSKFHRVINELRCSKEALVALKKPTNIIGGEYFIFVADPINPVLHCKKVGNRAQILRFNFGIDAPLPSEIYSSPLISEIIQIDQINPFMFGHDELLYSFGRKTFLKKTEC